VKHFVFTSRLFPGSFWTVGWLISIAGWLLFSLSPVSGQYYFGHNKVQYNQFEWQLLETTHFDIYFYSGEDQLARVSAFYAESSYRSLANRYTHEFSRKIPLIVYSSHFHFQETNTVGGFIPEGIGGFTEFLKGRVVMPFNGSYPKFQKILQHELVHAFMLDKLRSVFQEHNIFNYYSPPLWFTEGLAEHWSAGWDEEADMYLRDAVLNDYLFPIEAIYQINGSFLMYKEGQSFLNFLAEAYGDFKITRLFNEFWRFDNFYDLFEYIYQKPLAMVDQDWQYYLKKKYYPLMRLGELEPKVSILQTRKGFNFAPAVERNGCLQDKLYFFSSRMGYLGIYEKSSEIDTLSAIKDRAELILRGNFSEDFESFHFLQSRLALHDSLLVFVSQSGDKDVLYFYDLTKHKVIFKKRFEKLLGIYYPAWSEDGRFLAFSAITYMGNRDIYRYEWKKDSLEQLTFDHYDDLEPSFSPDGYHIAFSSDRGVDGIEGYYHLYLINTQTMEIQSITRGKSNFRSPIWKNSHELLYTSDFNGAFNIYCLDIENQINHQITNSLIGNIDVCYNSENNRIYYTGLNRFSYQIYQRSYRPLLSDSLQSEANTHSFFTNLKSWESGWPLNTDTISSEAYPIYKYKTRFSLDVAQSMITYDPAMGTSGGIQLLMSDMLGNQQWYFLLGNSARSKDEILKNFNVGCTYINLKNRFNYGVGIYHLADYYRYGYSYDLTYFERKYGALAMISYPLNRFQRIEFSFYIKNAFRDWYQEYVFNNALLAEQYLAYVVDKSMWGGVGPIDGYRFRIALGINENLTRKKLHYVLFLTDFRYYYRLTYQSCWATRLQLGYSSGQQPHLFWLGGSWSMRGYEHFHFVGRKLIQLNNELRFPIIQYLGIATPIAGISFNRIEGALFFDVGNAWNEHFEQLYGDFGFGFRLNLFNSLCLRWDFARTTDFTRFPKHAKFQFFFGWNY